MKKLSRQDIRQLIENKIVNLKEGSREDAMASAIANIEKQFGKGSVASSPSFDNIMMKQMQRARSPDVVQDIALAYDLMIKHAPNIESIPAITTGAITQSGLGQAVGEISIKTNLDKRFIRYHLNKAIRQEKEGKLIGLPTGQSLVQKVLDSKAAAQKKSDDHLAATTEMIGGQRITKIPAKGRGKGARTYGHTDIGTSFAPEDMPDEQAVQYLKDRFAGAPMWKFDISRDPESGKLYAYYEIDTSG